MKNTATVSFVRMYPYSLASMALWCILFYLPCIYFSPRGHLLGEGLIYALLCCGILALSLLMALAYKLFSLLKRMSPLRRDALFILCISYWYLPLAIFRMYEDGMGPSLLSMEMMKAFVPGIVVLPAPFLFVCLLRRAGRKNIPA